MEGGSVSGSLSASPSKAGKRMPKASPEKRKARTVSRPSRAVEDRIERAFSHRLYILGRGNPKTTPSGYLACDFHVLGNTGNAYTVTISQVPSCTCPDSNKGNVCKHRLFVMLRVLRRARDDPVVWQKALLSSELLDLLGSLSDTVASAASEGDVLADSTTRAAFALLSGTVSRSEGAGAEAGAKGGPGEGAKQRELLGDCPVCYEPFSGCAEAVVFCRMCGNNIHEDCFERWRSAKGGSVTCVWCRAPWIEAQAPTHQREGQHNSGDDGSQGSGGRGYLNLAQFSAGHRDNPEPDLEEVYPETYMHIGAYGRGRKRRWRHW